MKATHANIVGTQRGFRATVYSGEKIVASEHFNVKLVLKGFSKEVDKAYSEMKKWLAGFGVS